MCVVFPAFFNALSCMKPFKINVKATSQFLEAMNKRQLSEELECPVCFQLPRNPPIFQCENGHLICCDCQPKVNETCPQVRNNNVISDNIFLFLLL